MLAPQKVGSVAIGHSVVGGCGLLGVVLKEETKGKKLDSRINQTVTPHHPLSLLLSPLLFSLLYLVTGGKMGGGSEG